MKKELEQEIQSAVKEHFILSQDEKETLWEQIEQQLEATTPVQKRKRRRMPFVLTAAATIFLAFGFTKTETGTALVKTIQDMFEPEKTVEISIEGQDEKQHAKLVDGTQENNEYADFAFYVEDGRYEVKKEKHEITVTPKIQGENLPPIRMEIKQEKDKEVKKEAENLQKQLSEIYETIKVEEVTVPLNATKITAIEGAEWDSRVKVTYVCDNHRNGIFVVTQDYFMEASEGHGARFDHMLREFKVVK